jgi:hypothetical protein
MQKTRTGAAFALFLFLATSSFAAVDRDRDRGQDPNGAPTPIQRIVQLIKKIVKPLDAVIIPRP